MTKKLFTNKFWLVIGLCLIFALPSSLYSQSPPTNVFARSWPGSLPGGHEIGTERGRIHYYNHYREGRFYRPGFLGFWDFDFVIAPPVVIATPIGAIVAVLPDGYETVVVGGVPYYYYDGVYYKACPSGYLVVPAPVSPDGTVTINIPNSDGSYTAVKLVKHGDGYIGPQGEYYSGHPTVEQLKVLYGK